MKISSIIFASSLALAGSASAAMTWVHPGALDSKAELDFVKAKIAAGAEPWTSQLAKMKDADGGLLKVATPEVNMLSQANEALSRDDARRAYGNALDWYYTGDVAAANRAIAILNAWTVLQSINYGSDQSKLEAGWVGSLFGPAAEIMLGYSGWQAADIEKVRAMFKRAFYPVLNTASTWNGNVDLHQISAMMAIAVFNEDETEFNLAVTRLAARMPRYFYLTTDATPTQDSWFSPAQWLNGLTQETCRDNNHHSQFGMSGAFGAMETAWHQGVDLYSTYQTRMVAVEELMALQSFSGSMQGACSNNAASADVYATWEIGYNHLHNRKGIAMPNTKAMIEGKVRSVNSNGGSWSIFYETLTHAEVGGSGTVGMANKPAQSTMPASVLLRKGMCEIFANKAATYQITTLGLNGSMVNQASLPMAAGSSKLISLGLEGAPAGIYMVQVRSSAGIMAFKYIK
jgi:hypothetical protein